MKKKLIAMLAAMLAAMYTLAAVTISVSAKTMQKSGGGGTITVSGTGAWTAVSDSSWITVKSGTSGDGDGKVMFTVSENTTADTRIGHINVNDNVYTITQYGYTATISPSSVTVDRNGCSGTITVTADAGITWTATANVDWITVSPTSGRSVGTVTYTVTAYPGVVSRNGSITIAGNTFTVAQTGVDVNIEPAAVNIGPDADILMVDITALAATRWTVTPDASWISVLDKEQGYGDYALALAVNSNPSFARRTGTVAIGTATLTVIQDGKATAELAIDPEHATASASGAYGNVAVYATPDAPWTARSLTSWLTISEGSEGAGNGNIKYVASPNPTLDVREGLIKITPPYKDPEYDLNAGLLFEVTSSRYGVNGSRYSATESDNRYLSAAVPYTFSGSQILTIGGTDIYAKEDNAFTFSFDFSVGELGCINRLMKFGDKNLHMDIENRLWIQSDATEFIVEDANVSYTVVLDQDATGIMSVFAGKADGSTLSLVLRKQMTSFDFSSNVSLSQFIFGRADYPSSGYLTSGKVYSVRFWNRALTERESRDVNKSAALVDARPAFEKGEYSYYPLDGDAYYSDNGTTKLPRDTTQDRMLVSELTLAENRFGLSNRAMHGTGSGYVNFPYKLRTSYTNPYSANSGNFDATSRKSVSISLWVYLDRINDLPLVVKSNTGKTNANMQFGFAGIGKVFISLNGSRTEFDCSDVRTKEWNQITLVGKSSEAITIYVNGIEVGNVAASYSLGDSYCGGYVRYGTTETWYSSFTIGQQDGNIDDIVFYDDTALTSVEVRELYTASKAKVVYHAVTQGIQNARLSETNLLVAAAGTNASVRLTLAQGVNWSAAANCDWLHITSDTEGAGSKLITFTVDATPLVVNRTGTMTIGGITLTVEQVGLAAEVAPEKTFFDSVESDMSFIYVYTEGAGQWSAVSNDDWIMIDPETEDGNGAGTCWFYIDDYPLTTQSRTGSITIAGKTVYITQSGYKLSIDPMVADVGSNAGAGEIGVAASIDQVWDVITDCDWITIVNGRSGIGNGTVQYQFTDNTTGETRTGTIIIGGQKYTLTQRTTLPLATAVIGNGTISGAGNYNQGASVTLTATPRSGYVFSHWQGDVVGVSNQVTVAMDVAKNVSAVFIPESAAEQLAAAKAAQGGFYTRDQIHALEVGNLVLDVDAASGTARVGVQLMETSDLSDPNSWRPVGMTTGNLDVGSDGTVGLNVPATGNAKFFKVVVPQK